MEIERTVARVSGPVRTRSRRGDGLHRAIQERGVTAMLFLNGPSDAAVPVPSSSSAVGSLVSQSALGARKPVRYQRDGASVSSSAESAARRTDR